MKKLIVITAVGMCVCGSADSQRVVCDGNNCKIEPTGGAMKSRPSPEATAGQASRPPMGTIVKSQSQSDFASAIPLFFRVSSSSWH